MEKMLSGREGFRNSRPHRLRGIATGVLLALAASGSVTLAQEIRVTGTVSSSLGAPLQGVTVRVQGRDSVRVYTNPSGRYSILTPSDATLLFTIPGQRAVSQPVGGRTVIDVVMEAAAIRLQEQVVTGYTEQRRADITGAVASVNIESVQRQTAPSVLKNLDQAVPGVTVQSSGSPGSRSTVRIRGISSFQNNDPLYIVDGTPLQDSYINWLNPADITSIQVLKDASAASIYGSRASNGVILIETTKRASGNKPRMTFSARSGIASPTRGYDDFLITDALQYFQVIKRSYENANLPVPTNIYGDPNNPSVPQYIYAGPGTFTGTDAFGRPTGVDVSKYAYPGALIMQGSKGTNWWKEVFGPAPVSDYNMSVAGSGEDHTYAVSGNFFDQTGTAIWNRFRRGSVRANTSFTRSRFTFGENVALAGERSFGGVPDDPGGFAEDGIIGKNILMQPVVPVYDVHGNFASGKATTLGNQSNPVKFAFEHRQDQRRNNRVFGNVFGGLAILPELNFRSTIGFNVGQNSGQTYNPITPENSEPGSINSYQENAFNFTDWTWSNTLRFNRQLSDHNISLLLGQEANRSTNHRLDAGISSLRNTNINSRYVQDALGDASTKTVSSTGFQSALLSYFGKADYNFADRYVLSGTLRRDGSSRLGPNNRWGTFPAFGAGWRISKESFLEGNHLLSDAMLRFGWGVTGNQSIPAGRIFAQYGGGLGDTYYDITGSNTTIQPGFRQTSLGNLDLKWEENRATNVGADLGLFDNRINLIVDVYKRNTNNLLYNPALPGTAGIAAPPIVNIGAMKNTGFDVSLGHTGVNWNATLQASHYKNEIVKIGGTQTSFLGPNGQGRLNQTMVINKIGYPIGSFYGLVAQGFFRDTADVVASPKQDGAAPGRIKFKDVNGDGKITSDDRTIIGNPHPDLTASLDLGGRWKALDLSTTVFGSFGNDIFDAQKDFYVFRDFSTTVRRDLLTDSWTPTHQNAKYPRLDVNDSYSRAVSSFYVEDGSYVRLRNVQIGYTLPSTLLRWTSQARVYLQGENLLTFTGYDGLDPSLPTANINGSAGDIRDQYRGVDRGVYPTSRVFSLGLTTTF